MSFVIECYGLGFGVSVLMFRFKVWFSGLGFRSRVKGLGFKARFQEQRGRGGEGRTFLWSDRGIPTLNPNSGP